MKPKDVLGHCGEDLAAEFLGERGYRVIERNWRCPQGEIDVVAEQVGVTVFVEVKTRSGLRYGHPFEAITVAKLARLKRLAYAWCDAHPWGGDPPGDDSVVGTGRSRRPIRIDVIGVIAVPREPVVIEHLTGVF